MRLCSEDKREFVELSFEPASGVANPDSRVVVQITTDTVSFANHVWALGKAIALFTQQLEDLNRTRSGRAVLDSISPGDLHLEIRSADSSGHMLVSVSAARPTHVLGRTFKTAISTVFELDPTLLPALVDGLKRLPCHGSANAE